MSNVERKHSSFILFFFPFFFFVRTGKGLYTEKAERHQLIKHNSTVTKEMYKKVRQASAWEK